MACDRFQHVQPQSTSPKALPPQPLLENWQERADSICSCVSAPNEFWIGPTSAEFKEDLLPQLLLGARLAGTLEVTNLLEAPRED